MRMEECGSARGSGAKGGARSQTCIIREIRSSVLELIVGINLERKDLSPASAEALARDFGLPGPFVLYFRHKDPPKKAREIKYTYFRK
jgi:hypothetical protein